MVTIVNLSFIPSGDGALRARPSRAMPTTKDLIFPQLWEVPLSLFNVVSSMSEAIVRSEQTALEI